MLQSNRCKQKERRAKRKHKNIKTKKTKKNIENMYTYRYMSHAISCMCMYIRCGYLKRKKNSFHKINGLNKPKQVSFAVALNENGKKRKMCLI